MPGWKDLIVCDGTSEPCTFSHLIELVGVLIHDIFIIATFLTIVAFAAAGIILLTSGGDESKLKRAKGIFWNVLLGYVWILAAWVVVYAITSVLLQDGYTLLERPLGK